MIYLMVKRILIFAGFGGLILLAGFFFFLPLSRKNHRVRDLKLKIGAWLVGLMALSSQNPDLSDEVIFCYTPAPFFNEPNAVLTGESDEYYEFLTEIKLPVNNKILTGYCMNPEYRYLYQIINPGNNATVQEGELDFELDYDFIPETTPFQLLIDDVVQIGEYQLLIYHSEIQYENLLKCYTLVIE